MIQLLIYYNRILTNTGKNCKKHTIQVLSTHSIVYIPYLDAVSVHVGRVGHLSTCAAALFYQHCPGPRKPASHSSCTDLEQMKKHGHFIPLLHENLTLYINTLQSNYVLVYVFF